MMPTSPNRREFIAAAAAGIAGGSGLSALAGEDSRLAEPSFRISLAEWSLHRALQAGEMTNLDFPAVAKNELGIDALEYVNQFFMDKANDGKYLAELKSRCDDLGVRSVLIMCDLEGNLGDPDSAARTQAIENHYKWVEAAKFLGCHSIRVNAASSGSYDEQIKLATDVLSRLGEFADRHGLNVLVENHGGYSSNGAWLAEVMKQVQRSNVGTLPDFGNFQAILEDGTEVLYDRYQGVEELMPHAKAVSAKSMQFDDQGNEVTTDFFRMMEIVLAAGYHGHVGIEWSGTTPDELEGIRLTKHLLERVREDLV